MDYLESHATIKNCESRTITHIRANYRIKSVFGRIVNSGMLEQIPGTRTSGTAYRNVNKPVKPKVLAYGEKMGDPETKKTTKSKPIHHTASAQGSNSGRVQDEAAGEKLSAKSGKAKCPYFRASNRLLNPRAIMYTPEPTANTFEKSKCGAICRSTLKVNAAPNATSVTP
jgi:hypothetical protein